MGTDNKRILIVDDEVKIVEFVKSYLENSGYIAYEAYNGTQALEMYNQVNPSLVILDLMLPDISGEEVCRSIRRRSAVPIIMLTAKVEEDNILYGFDIGGDDYITKPFSPRQLIARVRALLRRTSDSALPFSEGLCFKNGDLEIDSYKYEVKKEGKSVSLTPIEYKILTIMIKHPAKVFTRDELIALIFGDDFTGYDRTIDAHIKNLRQKIETDNRHPKYIQTVHGVGYRFGGDLYRV